MYGKIALLFCMLPVALGAGPCDTLNQMNEADTADAGGECVELCDDAFSVDAVRADNLAFDDGVYTLSGSYPEGAYVSSSCFYDSLTLQLDCENAGMTAAMGHEGRRIEMTFQGAPEWLMVEMSFNQISLGEVMLEPVYEETPPSDPACRTNCLTAQEIIAIESL